MLKMKIWIIEPLEGIVKWDRYGVREDGNGFIFGWISREDSFYDFVVVNFRLIGSSLAVSYNTSSKKYSKEIGQRLKCPDETYLECKPVTEIVSEESSLIRWQKEHSQVDPQRNIDSK